MTREEIRPSDLRRLCRLLDIDVEALRVRPLSGGLTNRSFRFDHGGHSWAVRLPFESRAHRLHTLDAATEARVLGAVARAGLTPHVILHDAASGALVTEYLHRAVPWCVERARRPENVRRIAAVLRSLHAVELAPGLRPFRPVELSEAYVESARRQASGRAGFSDEERSWARQLRRLAVEYGASFPPTVLCHHDLVAANILDAGRLWLVDFEYALQAHPILDLASVAGMNGYDAHQCEWLLGAYFDAEPVAFRAEQLRAAVRLERLLSYFWAISQRDDSAEPNAMSRFADAMAAMLR